MKTSWLISIMCIAPLSVSAGEWQTDYALNLNNFYGYTDYSKPYNHYHKQNNLNSTLNAYGQLGYEFNEDYFLSLNSFFMIDSAKKVENYNQGIWGEEIYLEAETPYGKFSAGQNYNVAYDFAVGAPTISNWRVNNTDLTNFITNPNWYKKDSKMLYKTLNSTYINTDGTSLKTSYVTPEFQGIKLGATYVPKTYSQDGLIAKNSPYKDKEAYILGAYGYWDILGYELETSLGFADYNKNDTEYSSGFSVYRRGWTLGASYRKTETNGNVYAINRENLYDAYREGQAYNLGLSYEIGPFTTGVTYFDSKSDKTNNHDEIISFVNGWKYNKYVTFSFIVAHLNSRGETADIQENSKGYAFITGLELSL